MTVTREQFDKIQKHAIENYEKNGWDYVVEVLDLPGMQDIADMSKCKTYGGLFRAVRSWAKLNHEVESDIQGS